MAMRYKITNLESSPYGYGDGTWALVKKVVGGYELLNNPVYCKDYIHEYIANVVNGKRIFSSGLYDLPAVIKTWSLETLSFVLFFRIDNTEHEKRNLYSVKKYINSIEKKCGIKQSSIVEVSCGAKAQTRAFVITCDKTYIESPVLIHGLIAYMRTLRGTYNINSRTITPTLANNQLGNDKRILFFINKYNIFKLVMENHANIFKDLTLKDIYPPQQNNLKGGGYHSGFGMVALCTRTLSSNAYAKRMDTLLKDNNIPKFNYN